VERVADTEPTDGLWIDGCGRLYLSAIEQDAVKFRDGDRITTLVQDKRLRWPDTFAEGPDGTVYVTSSRIQRRRCGGSSLDRTGRRLARSGSPNDPDGAAG
jgi:sugar lactone lactonase YvrE